MPMNVKKIYALNYSQRIINAFGGLLVIFILASHYGIVDADKFYSVFSLLGLVAFYEFGYATLIVQRISYYSIDENKVKVKDAIDVNHYMCMVNIFSFVIVFSFPFVGGGVSNSLSYFELFSMSIILAAILKLSMSVNVMEGLGYLYEVAKIRLFQAIASYISMSILLLLGFGYKSVLYQLLCQFIVLLYFCISYFKRNNILPILKKNMFFSNRLRAFSKPIFLKDIKYSTQLYLTAISAIFSNQIWIIALSHIGVANISKYAISLQIITACAGFSLTPIASRLSHLARANYLGDSERKRLLMREIIKDIAIATLICLIGVSFIYGYAFLFYNDRVLSLEATAIMLLSIPFMIAVSIIGIIVQSKGIRDITLVSIAKITVPACIFFLLNNDSTDVYIASCYFGFNVISLLIASMYIFKEH